MFSDRGILIYLEERRKKRKPSLHACLDSGSSLRFGIFLGRVTRLVANAVDAVASIVIEGGLVVHFFVVYLS